MGEFVEWARRRDALSPRRRGFTEASWRQAFDEHAPHDEADVALRDAGLALFSKFTAVRAMMTRSPTASLTPSTQARAYVAAANYNVVRARAMTVDALRREAKDESDGAFTALERVFQIRLPTVGGAHWSPSEIVESMTEAIEIPVRLALSSNGPVGSPRMRDVDWRAIALEVNLGITYRFAEDLWDDCLWNDYRMVDSRVGRMFVPLDVEAVRAHVIGITRAQRRNGGFTVVATAAVQRAMQAGVIPRITAVRGVERRGRRQIVRLAKRGMQLESAQSCWVMRTLAVEPFYESFLQDPLASLGGLSLSQVLDAWMIVAQACRFLYEGLVAADAQRSGRGSFADYAPILHIDALVRAVQDALNLSPPAARRLIDFLTFTGHPGQELWAQPLVPVSAQAVAPVLVAAVFPQLRRVIDVWMRQLNVDLALRGPAFEAYVRSVAVEGVRTSPMLQDLGRALPGDLRFRPIEGIDDQIDLVFAVGKNVFVGESKCILEPSDAKSLAMHRRTVEEGAEQAKLRVRHIHDHRDAFRRLLGERGMHVDDGFEVRPLIVVSTSTLAGSTVLDVPVVDSYILGRFFDGETERVAVSGDPPQTHIVGHEIFYVSADEAEALAPLYFADPPQLAPYVRGIKPRMVPLFSVDQDDWFGSYLTMECDPPTPDDGMEDDLACSPENCGAASDGN